MDGRSPSLLTAWSSNVGLEHVASELEDLDAWVLEGLFNVIVSSAAEVVVDDDFLHVLLDQFVDDVRADESGPADDEYSGAPDVARGCLHVIVSLN